MEIAVDKGIIGTASVPDAISTKDEEITSPLSILKSHRLESTYQEVYRVQVTFCLLAFPDSV